MRRRSQPGLPAVIVSPVVEREITAGQTFVGTVMPLKKAIIGSAVDGRVVEFPLDEGDRVEQGQTLAQLLTDTIKLEVETAEAELKLRQAAVGRTGKRHAARRRSNKPRRG